MPQCRMVLENNRQCGCYLYTCKNCKAVGCDNTNCRNVTFDKGNGMCYRCLQTSAR